MKRTNGFQLERALAGGQTLPPWAAALCGGLCAAGDYQDRIVSGYGGQYLAGGMGVYVRGNSHGVTRSCLHHRQVSGKLDIRLFLAFRLCLFAYTLFGKAIYIISGSVVYLGYFQLLDVAGKRSLRNRESAIFQFFKQFFLITYHFRLYNTANGIQSFLLCTHVVYLCKTGCKYKEYC